MAELSLADRKAILGANYQEPEVTAATLAESNSAKRDSRRNIAIGIAVLAAVILIAVFYGSQGITR